MRHTRSPWEDHKAIGDMDVHAVTNGIVAGPRARTDLLAQEVNPGA
jgi:hypothetical protein